MVLKYDRVAKKWVEDTLSSDIDKQLRNSISKISKQIGVGCTLTVQNGRMRSGNLVSTSKTWRLPPGAECDELNYTEGSKFHTPLDKIMMYLVYSGGVSRGYTLYDGKELAVAEDDQ